MDWLACLEKFFNNQSVGAFIGAAAAFALVVLNDWRRDLRKVRNIKGEVEMNLGLARSKLETVRRNRDAMRAANQIIPAPILKFNTTLIRELAALVLDRARRTRHHPAQRRHLFGAEVPPVQYIIFKCFNTSVGQRG